MKVKLLAKISNHGDEYQITSQAEPRLIIIDSNKDEGVIRLAEYFDKHLVKTLGKWIDFWKNMGEENACNCPEGYIELPIDLWKCKYNKNSCNLQARVDISDRNAFFKGCTATIKQKEGIFTAIKNGKYDGFHHVPGRNLCVMCEQNPKKSVSHQYHYEIEMQFIEDLISETEDDFLRIIAKSKYPRAIKYCAICTECTLEILADLFPIHLPKYQMMVIDYYER